MALGCPPNLPAGWDRDRLKDIVTRRTAKVSEQSERKDYLELEDLSSGTGQILNRRDTLSVQSAVTRFFSGDVLLGKLRPYLAKFGQPDFDGKCTGEILALCPKRIHGRFLYYCVGSHWFVQLASNLAYGAKMPRVSWTKQLGQFEMPLPPVDEQRLIAQYLDSSCKSIEQAFEKKRRQLDTLVLLGASVIHEAVTQGLKPDVPMRDSGVDWLGTIPAHWRVTRVKRHSTLLRGRFTHRPRNDPALYDGPYPFIQTGDIASADKYIEEYSQTLNERGLAASRRSPKGTIVMSIAANIGDVAIMNFEGCFPDSIVGFVPDHHLDPDFLFYLLKCMKPVMLRSAVITTQLNINYIRIGGNYCPIPPTDEQAQIARTLDDKMQELAKIQASLSAQIEVLRAYRSSLIHEYTTGERRIAEPTKSGKLTRV